GLGVEARVIGDADGGRVLAREVDVEVVGEAGRVADGDVAIGRTRAGRQVVDLLPRGRAWNVRGVRNQVVGFGVLAGHERRLRHPVLSQVLVVIGLVDEDVTVDVEHGRVPGRHMELGVADGLARRRYTAERLAMLGFVALRGA